MRGKDNPFVQVADIAYLLQMLNIYCIKQVL